MQEWRIKEMNLTPIKVKFPFNARSKVVREEMEANKVQIFIIGHLGQIITWAHQVNETWAASSWAKRMAMKKKRAGLTDLDRFKLRKAKSARNKIITKVVNGRKKALRKAGKL